MTVYINLEHQPFSGYNIQLCQKKAPEVGFAAFYHTWYYAEPSPDSEVLESVTKIAEHLILYELRLLVEDFIVKEGHLVIEENNLDWSVTGPTGLSDEEDIL